MCPSLDPGAKPPSGNSDAARCDVAVVMPVYRNRTTLAELAARLGRALAAYPAHRLIFVVDHSPDDSWDEVLRLAQGDARICGVLLAANEGQHRAVLAGLHLAHANCAVIMDADLQDPPELVPEMVDLCLGADTTVFALRTGRYQSRARMASSRIFKSILGALVGLPANAGMFIALPPIAVDRMCRAPVRCVQIVVLARALSSRWQPLHYVRSHRPEGKSAYSTLGRLRAAARALACAWECRAPIGTQRTQSPQRADVPIASRVNI